MNRTRIGVSLTVLCLVVSFVAGAAVLWRAVLQKSELGFTATQAGAKFQGSFKQYSANVQFDPKDLANSRLEVTIDLTSVDTQDEDRDVALKGAEFFWTERYPRAVYLADKIAEVSPGVFKANGTLTLRNVSREIPITFKFRLDGAGAEMTGTGSLKRLDFGVGKGEWQSTEWLANEVDVNFKLRLEK